MKILWILLFLFICRISLGQDIVFLQNTNPVAKELKQSLCKTQDSLVLSSTKIITQVDIINEGFKKTIPVNKLATKIDLSSLPSGEYVVQARSDKKWIVMYVIKGDKSKQFLDNGEVSAIQDGHTELTKLKPSYTSREEFFRAQKANKITKYKQSIFWVVYETKTGSGSGKSMGLKSEREVVKMISKNKLELGTKVAKHNTLLVYEVYDPKGFMRNQFRNPEYFKSETSEFFNPKPYYISESRDDGI